MSYERYDIRHYRAFSSRPTMAGMDEQYFNPLAHVGRHRLSNNTIVFVTSAHLPREGDPAPIKFSDGSVYAPSRAEAERIAILADRLKVLGLDNSEFEVVGKTNDGLRLVRARLRLPYDALEILDALDLYARKNSGIVWVSMPVVSAIREMSMQGRYQRVAAMIATPETRRAAPADKVVMADTWSVP